MLKQLIVKKIQNEVWVNRLCVAKYPVGLDSRKDDVMKLLKTDACAANQVRILGICGIGGAGKTTLAKAVYNDLSYNFEARSYVENVRDRAKDVDGLISLQKQILGDILKRKTAVENVSKGTNKMSNHMKHTQVLIVIDDVDHKEQIDALAGSPDWFHSGSIIIITSRDTRVIRVLTDNIHNPKLLNDRESIELFSWHGFGMREPKHGYYELSREVSSIAKGLPLCVEVFGSHFFDLETMEEWTDALEKLKDQYQHKDVHEKLKISFDRLDEQQQRIFLDITCFFIGEGREYATLMWEECRLYPRSAITLLQHKSLVSIDDDTGEFQMHDQIRDMGRKIVSEKGDDSRIWKGKQAKGVLELNKGLETEGIALREGTEIESSTQGFEQMYKLRLLHLNSAIFTYCDFGHFPSNLKWLGWKGCPLESMATDCKMKDLVILNLSGSAISQLWISPDVGWNLQLSQKLFVRLKILDLSHCCSLVQSPNFFFTPNLEKLLLDGCEHLEEVDESVGSLKKLAYWSMRGCKSLRKLPNSIEHLACLKVLHLERCDTVISFLGYSQRIMRVDVISKDNILDKATSLLLERFLQNATSILSKLKEYTTNVCEWFPQTLESLILHIEAHNYFKIFQIFPSRKDLERLWSLDKWETVVDVICHGYSSEFYRQHFVEPCNDIISEAIQDVTLRNFKKLYENRAESTLALAGNENIVPNEKVVFEAGEEDHSDDDLSGMNEKLGYNNGLYFDIRDEGRCFARMKLSKAPSTCTVDIKFDNTSGVQNANVPVHKKRKLCGKIRGISDSPLEFSFSSSSNWDNDFEATERSWPPYSSTGDVLKPLFAPSPTGLLQHFGWSLEEFVVLQLSPVTTLIIACNKEDFGGKPYHQENGKVFDNVKILDLCDCEILLRTPNLCCVPNLEMLILDGCQKLEEIDDSVGNLQKLVHLSLRNCLQLRKLPIGQLESLKELILDDCHSLNNLPSSIGNLKNLRLLSFKHNEESKRSQPLVVPDTIGNLLNLRHLFIDCCHIDTQKSLGFMGGSVSLQLSLHDQRSYSLSRMSGSQTSSELLIHDHKIECLPSCLGDMKNIYCLSLKNCGNLRGFPDTIGQLKSLRELLVEDCGIDSLPDSIGNLPNLDRLSLKRCFWLTTLPNSLRGLESLRELLIDDCWITSLPDSIGDLQNLVRLSLNQCRLLTTLPNALGRLKSLRELLLDFCVGITAIDVSGCRCLKVLHTRSCWMLKSIRGLESLESLETLHLAGCPSLDHDLICEQLPRV